MGQRTRKTKKKVYTCNKFEHAHEILDLVEERLREDIKHMRYQYQNLVGWSIQFYSPESTACSNDQKRTCIYFVNHTRYSEQTVEICMSKYEELL